MEVPTPSGSIDVLSKTELIEVKFYRSWKTAVGQVIAYGHYYPSHTKRLHLFAQKGDKIASKYIQLATPVCSAYGIDVTFEEVSHTSHDLASAVATTENVTSAGPGTGEKRKQGESRGNRPSKKVKVARGRVVSDQEARAIIGRMHESGQEMMNAFLPGMTSGLPSQKGPWATYREKHGGDFGQGSCLGLLARSKGYKSFYDERGFDGAQLRCGDRLF